jgi:hypothetical protein
MWMNELKDRVINSGLAEKATWSLAAVDSTGYALKVLPRR